MTLSKPVISEQETVKKALRIGFDASSMKITTMANFAVVLLAGLACGAERNPRFARKFQIPGSPEVAVVAEGDFEPRSTGSYAIRVYRGSSKEFSTDDFDVGLAQFRNGTVEAVRFDDIDGDGRLEIVVIIRAVGSGGYLSADAFSYRTGSLQFVASVSDLDKGADPIQALRGKFKARHGKKSSSSDARGRTG